MIHTLAEAACHLSVVSVRVTTIHGSLVLILLSATLSSGTSQDRAGSPDQALQSAELLLPQKNTPYRMAAANSVVNSDFD